MLHIGKGWAGYIFSSKSEFYGLVKNFGRWNRSEFFISNIFLLTLL